jgi:hypothetical protein
MVRVAGTPGARRGVIPLVGLRGRIAGSTNSAGTRVGKWSRLKVAGCDRVRRRRRRHAIRQSCKFRRDQETPPPRRLCALTASLHNSEIAFLRLISLKGPAALIDILFPKQKVVADDVMPAEHGHPEPEGEREGDWPRQALDAGFVV